MKREKMEGMVREELVHIPRGERGSPQNELRAGYNMLRRHDLSIPNPEGRKTTITKMIEQLKKSPDAITFPFQYDKEFFDRS